MSDGRIRTIGVPPAGPGLKRALAKLAKEAATVTSFDDARLAALRALAPEDRDLDFVPIGDLVGRFLTMNGEPIKVLFPKGQLQAAIDVICRDLPHDTPLSASARFPGTSSLVRERLGELRDWKLAEAEIETVIAEATSPLKEKLAAVADVDRKVHELMHETNREFASDRVARSLEIPPDRPLPVRQLIVAAGATEKPVYEDWIKWVASFGIEVVVLLDAPVAGSKLFATQVRAAQRLGTKIEVFEKDDPWYTSLFSDSVREDAPVIEIVATADPLHESEWIVRGCLALLAQGTLPHQIAIFARDPETYAPLLTASADRLGLPLTASLNVPLLSNGFACLVLDSLEALAGDDVRALARIAHSTYFGTDPESYQAIVAATQSAFVTGRDQWNALTAWAEGQGDGLGWFKRLLQWRSAAVSSRRTLAGWHSQLRDLADGTNMVDLAAEHWSRTRQRDINAQTVLQRSVRDIAMVHDRTQRIEMGLESFVLTARALWEQESVAIEGLPNGVKLLSSTAQLTEYRAVFVAGMLEGTFPRRRSEDPIFFDSERAEISRILGGGVRLPDSRDRAAAERDEFVRLCSSATERIVLSYPATDDSRDNVPAFYLDELQRACPKTSVVSVRPRSQFVPVASECFADSDVRVRSALDGARRYRIAPELSHPLAMEIVRPQFEVGVTPEQLNLSLVCEFHASMRHALRVFPPPRRRLMRSMRDLPSVAGLATTPNRAAAKKVLSDAIAEYVQGLSAELEAWESSMLSAAADRLLDEWVDREFRSRELWSEPGESSVQDPRLGEHGLRDEVKVDGRTVRLKGGASSLTRRGRYTVMRFYDSYVPKLSDITDLPRDNDDALLYGLYLMSQLKLDQRNPAVEVDGMGGGRLLAVFDDVAGDVKRDPKHQIVVNRIAESRDLFFQNVMQRLREAVRKLDAAKMTASPGDHCRRCPYGEICRVSSEFGDVADPFAEAQE